MRGRLLIALDECSTSTGISCNSRPTHNVVNGEVQNFHAILGANIVVPGTSSLLPQAPEFVQRRDRAATQDCRITVVKRWMEQVGPGMERSDRFNSARISTTADRSVR